MEMNNGERHDQCLDKNKSSISANGSFLLTLVQELGGDIRTVKIATDNARIRTTRRRTSHGFASECNSTNNDTSFNRWGSPEDRHSGTPLLSPQRAPESDSSHSETEISDNSAHSVQTFSSSVIENSPLTASKSGRRSAGPAGSSDDRPSRSNASERHHVNNQAMVRSLEVTGSNIRPNQGSSDRQYRSLDRSDLTDEGTGVSLEYLSILDLERRFATVSFPTRSSQDVSFGQSITLNDSNHTNHSEENTKLSLSTSSSSQPLEGSTLLPAKKIAKKHNPR